jgi:thiamine biosynthesis lipoprotein
MSTQTPVDLPLEHRRTFDCFGGRCTVLIADTKHFREAATAAAMGQRALLTWHARFTRFDPDSELSEFNRDPRYQVPVSPLLRQLVEAAVRASHDTGGLVDATLGSEIRRAGYARHIDGDGIPLSLALAKAPPRAPAGPNPADRWCRISVDRRQGTVTRPPGTTIDLGGIAKGVLADELGTLLGGFKAFAVDCDGDIRIGGEAMTVRDVHVASPFDGSTLHSFSLSRGGIATSGIRQRSWMTDGGPAHQLLDPRTGTPAFTGLVQATALAPTAAQADVLAKAAVLSGPRRASEWLPYGGVLVRDDGSYDVLEPATSRSAAAAADDADTWSVSQALMSANTTSRSGSLRISWNRPS